MVEFALVLPILLLLLAGGVDLARAYFVGIEMSNAAREASLYLAREAPYASGPSYAAELPPGGAYSGCPATAGGSEGPAIDAGCSSFAGSILSCPSNELHWTISPTSLPAQTPPSPGTDSSLVTVHATCNLDMLTPLLPAAVTVSGTSTSWMIQP
jgi:hypothetical protein